jgi:hypothetical protein
MLGLAESGYDHLVPPERKTCDRFLELPPGPS